MLRLNNNSIHNQFGKAGPCLCLCVYMCVWGREGGGGEGQCETATVFSNAHRGLSEKC